MNKAENMVLDIIDVDALLQFARELIAIQSLDGSPEENDAQELVAAKMAEVGCSVDIWELDLDAIASHPAYSAEVVRQRALGVVGAMGAGQGQSLILNGHVDVVPVNDTQLWYFPTWQGTIREGRLYGRGALDMKGALCCAVFAAKAIQDAGLRLKGKLLIESVIGEEDGGTGTLGTILRGYRADAAVVLEPTGLAIAPSQAGALNFRVTVHGKTAHGALRQEGVSAIEKFIPLHRALLELESKRNLRLQDPLFKDNPLPFALNIGNLQAGDWASNVPEKLVFEGRYGIAPGEDIAQARREFEETLHTYARSDDWLREHPPAVEWWGGQFLPASIPPDHPIVTCISSALRDAADMKPVVRGMPYGADMRLLINEAQTSTVLFGPGDISNAHRPDEYVPISDLIAATRTLALAALRYCGVGEAD